MFSPWMQMNRRKALRLIRHADNHGIKLTHDFAQYVTIHDHSGRRRVLLSEGNVWIYKENDNDKSAVWRDYNADPDTISENIAGDLWGEHPKYARASWKEEVQKGYTQLGYWLWTQHAQESEESEQLTEESTYDENRN